ncbi:unnamed protein product [Adineta ricciae]|uniref:LicD/FKTN/FKRP nucleotidyltransferase domain-containing protein n=1 Tax=Adineta ricciae TaxID=249248 RepID=A0A814TAQ3_ADIRI|nr:unnamed protein product [Adineta ricciae]CAF1159467.1 unnamed protein product [Adineta ricciae]
MITISIQWNTQIIFSVYSKSVPTNVTPCAYLACSHSSNCTTRNKTCCAYVLKRSLDFLDVFFRRHHLPYVIIYGSLLGAVRNRTIIPWTRDIDIGFFNWTYLRSESIRNELYQHGFYLFHTLDLTRICVHKDALDKSLLLTQNTKESPPTQIFHLHAYVDLYLATNPANLTRNSSIYSIEFSGKFLSHISFKTNATIDNQTYPTVDNVQEHLVHFYKKDYMRDVIPRRP